MCGEFDDFATQVQSDELIPDEYLDGWDDDVDWSGISEGDDNERLVDRI